MMITVIGDYLADNDDEVEDGVVDDDDVLDDEVENDKVEDDGNPQLPP